MQMVELLGLVAVGIHHKRHSAPRPLKIPGDTSLSLQQEEDEPEPLVIVASGWCLLVRRT